MIAPLDVSAPDLSSLGVPPSTQEEEEHRIFSRGWAEAWTPFGLSLGLRVFVVPGCSGLT